VPPLPWHDGAVGDDPDAWRIDGRIFVVTVVSDSDGPGLDLDEATPHGDRWTAAARLAANTREVTFDAAEHAPSDVIERFRRHAHERLLRDA
jgi:hypothetical protein